MQEPDFGEPTRAVATHQGRGKGVARVDYEEDGSLHRFVVPYHFPHSPDGPKLQFLWDEMTYEGDWEYGFSKTPEAVKHDVTNLSESARKKANY